MDIIRNKDLLFKCQTVGGEALAEDQRDHGLPSVAMIVCEFAARNVFMFGL